MIVFWKLSKIQLKLTKNNPVFFVFIIVRHVSYSRYLIIKVVIGGFVLGPEQVHPSFLKAAMAPIALIGGSYQYPPLNWASILAPLLRLDFGMLFFKRIND